VGLLWLTNLPSSRRGDDYGRPQRHRASQAAIDEELRDSADYAVDSIHDRAQGSPGILPYNG